jgi:hypothetical protein
MRASVFGVLAFLAFALGCASAPHEEAPATATYGQFENAQDVGDVGLAGATAFDAGSQTYRVTGSGANMWADVDAFQFVWTRMEGDLAIAADVAWEGEGGDAHRKAGVIIRDSLEPDSAYADVVVHGDGLTSLQYREEKGGPTRQIEAALTHARRIKLERIGDYVYFSAAGADGALKHAGGSVRVRLSQNAYVGLAVCAHVRGRPETARFSNVELARLNLPPPATTGYGAPVESALEVLNMTGGRYGPGNRRVVRYFPTKIESPNWSRDGRTLIYNSGGLIYRIPVEGGEPSLINTGPLRRNNNDHGISPDGTQLIVSDQSEPDDISRIYILPIEGSDNPRRVVSHPTARSYWHAWSPDGRTIAYTASRPETAEGYDIYARNLTGGRERRLTRHPGLDDGPDFSPDARYIYFNSTRSGNMKIWRMRADGSNPEQATFDEDTRDWFPHPSPDGRWLAFVSFGLDIDVNDHPPNRDVSLRIMPMDGSAPPRVVARLFGGQGTINVPSWSPDSTQLAFVSYRLVR